jgi:murein DD-endopeptidase MepM/ murein hydrolase activator NlpD
MFIPGENARPFSFRVSAAVVRGLAVFFVMFVVGLAALLFRSGEIGVRLQLLGALREENAGLKEQNKKLLVVAEKLESMQRITAYLRRVATATGEGDKGAPAVASASGGEEQLFEKDSFDNFLEEVRLTEAEGYKHLSSVDATPELLLGSIPNIRPVQGWVTRAFSPDGAQGPGPHLGVDFAAAEGALIRSSAPGTVDDVFHDKYFGLVVSVKHRFGFETRYGHCSQVLVSAGDVVERGQAIALVGNTGRSSGPHLHYEVLRNEKQVDPMRYMLTNIAGR